MHRQQAKHQYPITSYGILLFVQEKTGEEGGSQINFLLHQRRDTYEYIEFIRGMWETIDEVKKFFSLMSAEERQRITNHTFDELWNDFWIRHPSNLKDKTLNRPRTKYEQIEPFIPRILEETKANGEEAPWGFPKGRKNAGEKPIVCAVREFEEETRIQRTTIHVWDEVCFTENFVGSDQKLYSTVYYIAEYRPSPPPLTPEECTLPPLLETPNGIRKYTASTEAFRVKWFSFDGARKTLPPFRQEILAQAVEYIGTNLNTKSI